MLLSKGFVATFGQQLNEVARGAELVLDIVHLPDDAQARLSQVDCDRIEVALQTRDIRCSEHYRSFVDTLIAARNLIAGSDQNGTYLSENASVVSHYFEALSVGQVAAAAAT